jgi:hypothetical protein
LPSFVSPSSFIIQHPTQILLLVYDSPAFSGSLHLRILHHLQHLFARQINPTMGLRPSVRDDDNNLNKFTSPPPQQQEQINNSSRNSNQESASSSSAASSTQREAWTARGQLLLNFHNVIARAINSPEMIRKCSHIAEDMRRSEDSIANQSIQPTSSSSNAAAPATAAGRHQTMAEEYSAEAALIVENKSKRDAVVMNKAIAVGISSFVTLRSCRGLSRVMRKSITSSRSYQFDKIAASKSMLADGANLKFNVVALDQPSKLRKFFSLTLDVTTSTSIALLSGTFLFMPRPSAYIEDMSKLPLVEGKSVYAEMVCPPLLKEYRRVLMKYGGRWPVNTGSSATSDNAWDGGDASPKLTQEDVSLNVIRSFVKNCYKRSIYERALLEERSALSYEDETDSTVSRLMKRIERRIIGNETMNDSTLGTVSVPSPGVPEEISVNLDSEILSLPPDDGKE